MKPAAALCGSAMVLAAFPGTLSAADTQEPPIVRTEEDLIKGKQNIRSVMDELSELFSDNAPLPQTAPSNKPIEPPFCKIIPGLDGRSTLIFRPRFTSAKKMFKAIDGVIVGATLIEPLEEQNEVIIAGNTEEIKSYQEILLAMDIPSPQILIEAKIVEVLFSDGMQRNLSFTFQGDRYKTGATTEVPGTSTQPSTGAGGNFTPYAGKDSMNIAFQWLLTAQDAKVLSSPNILISRSEVSRIVTGEEIPIQEANTTGNNLQLSTTFKSVGVTLEVEPSMINRDNVTLRVYPKVSNVVRYENVSAGSGTSYPVPVISARSVETHLRMQDKQVVMMGGLYNSRKTLQQQRVPVLSDMPWVGELFTGKNESKEITQLIFFLKIHIISPEEIANGVFYDFDRDAERSEKLGEIVENSEHFPTRDTSVKKFKDEIEGALPGKVEEKRRKFKNTPIWEDDTTSMDNNPITVKATVESKPAADSVPESETKPAAAATDGQSK